MIAPDEWGEEMARRSEFARIAKHMGPGGDTDGGTDGKHLAHTSFEHPFGPGRFVPGSLLPKVLRRMRENMAFCR